MSVRYEEDPIDRQMNQVSLYGLYKDNWHAEDQMMVAENWTQIKEAWDL